MFISSASFWSLEYLEIDVIQAALKIAQLSPKGNSLIACKHFEEIQVSQDSEEKLCNFKCGDFIFSIFVALEKNKKKILWNPKFQTFFFCPRTITNKRVHWNFRKQKQPKKSRNISFLGIFFFVFDHFRFFLKFVEFLSPFMDWGKIWGFVIGGEIVKIVTEKNRWKIKVQKNLCWASKLWF